MPNLAQALLSLALLAVPFAHHAAARPSACSKPAIVRSAEQVKDARQDLLALLASDGFQTDVPPHERHAIAAMQARLGDFVTTYMRCAPLVPDPATIGAELARAHALKETDDRGVELAFDVKKPEGHLRLLAVTATFAIECGSDAMLFVFARDNGAWHEVLRWQSKPYRTVAGAFWSFGYAISPPDAHDHWFVATKFVSPWCSSTWSSITYSILRPVPDRREPRALLTASDGMWWGNEDFGALTSGRTSVDLRFHSSSIDTGVHNRVWIKHFTVIGNAVRRAQPAAASPGDFADEWIVSAWKDASLWSAKHRIGALQRAHRRLHKLHYFDYVSVRECSDRPDHHQIELAHEDAPPYYFHVIGRTAYEMAAIATKPETACAGKNLMDEPDRK